MESCIVELRDSVRERGKNFKRERKEEREVGGEEEDVFVSLSRDGMGAFRISDIKIDTSRDETSKISRRAQREKEEISRSVSVPFRFSPRLPVASSSLLSVLSWFSPDFSLISPPPVRPLVSVLSVSVSVSVTSRATFVRIFPQD